MIADGIHPNMHRREYDRVERVNFSTLKWMDRSAAHYHHVLTTPSEDTDPKRLGRVVHLAAFEPERFRNAVAVWDGGARRGKDWTAFCERNQDRELLTEAQYETCLDIQRAVRADARAMKYVTGGQGEVSLLWTRVVGEGANRYSFECKGRIDFDAQDAIVDLKTTKCASPKDYAFARQVVSLGYDAQAAWYSDGYEAATGIRKPYVIVAVDNTAPFKLVVYRVPERVLARGREKYSRWLDTLGWCREHSQWPGYSEIELDLELPPWAMPLEGTDAMGVEFDTEG